MARVKGIEPEQAGWHIRVLYWFTRRSFRQLTGQDRLPEPVKIVAHQPALLRAIGRMEMAQAAARSVDRRLKHLAGLRASTLAGCPF
jgi:4-carboxymuconolactone decarboxylase